MHGVILTIYPSKGYGFVRGEDDNMTRFVHARDCVPRGAFDRMYIGQRVEFEPTVDLTRPSTNNLRAVNVSPVEEVKHA